MGAPGGVGAGTGEVEYAIDFADGVKAMRALRTHARAENTATALKVLTAAVFARRGFEDDLTLFGDDAVHRAGRGAEMEIALALGVSHTTAVRIVRTGEALETRLPSVRAAFLGGRLDYARVRRIAEDTDDISDATLRLIEGKIADAALHRAPRALSNEIMRILINADPDEAARVRKLVRARHRYVSVKPSIHGLTTLYANLDAAEGRLLDSRIHDMAATVCDDDPRSRDHLRVDAFMALVRGDRYVHCLCGTASCPVAHLPEPEPLRPEVHIHVDLDTLLGLADHPAHLDGHGPIDPELARHLAEDGTWQAIITEARRIAEQAERDPADATSVGDDPEPTGAETGHRGHSAESRRPAEAGQPRQRGAGSDSGAATGPDRPAPPRSARHRTRRRPAGTVPRGCTSPTTDTEGTATEGTGALTDSPPPPAVERPANWPYRLPPNDLTVAAVLEAIERDPTLLLGEFANGHGGLARPPKGALTYRPSRAVRDAVFDRYPTCAFPGCETPSARCQFDHIVEYDHDDPLAGGWTVDTNGQPACGLHHQAKTDRHFRVARLPGDVLVWVGRSGTLGVTLPRPPAERGTPARRSTPRTTRSPVFPPPPDPSPPPPEPDDPIYHPTWWESHMRVDDPSPTLAEIATTKDEDDRARLVQLRAHHAEHVAILAEREKHRPPPF